MTPGLVITPSGCTATPFGSEAMTIQCAFTVANNGTDTLIIGIASVLPSGAVTGIQPLELLPGTGPVQIGAPPSGGAWLVVAKTQGEINAAQDWYWFWTIVIGAAAGWSFGELIWWIMRKAGWVNA